MARVSPVSESETPKGVEELFLKVRQIHGTIPNIFKAMGHSPSVLKGYLDLNTALHTSTLSPELREKIALAVGQINRCKYCLSAHSAIAKKIGLSDDDIQKARHGEDADARTQEILRFVRHSVENRGWITDEQVLTLRGVGVNDRELVEISMAIAINLFTNYFNHIANPDIDYPAVDDL